MHKRAWFALCSNQEQEKGMSAPLFSTGIDSILEDLQASQLFVILLLNHITVSNVYYLCTALT